MPRALPGNDPPHKCSKHSRLHRIETETRGFPRALADPRVLHSLEEERSLPGIELNEDEQLALLSRLTFSTELLNFPKEGQSPGVFNVSNGSFELGDFELWYNIVRHKKPRRIIEVGSGMSTLITSMAIKRKYGRGSRVFMPVDLC